MSAKSKKKGVKVLLLPAANGWEVWTGGAGEPLSRVLESGEKLALEVDGVPSGEFVMAFPVRDVSALPFLAPTSDDSLLNDLAEMHIERLGMRPAADAGILTDTFRVGTRGENSLLLPVVLAPPPEGHLPKRAPQAFDISARCLPLPSEGVVVWRELGRWVFAVSENGQPMHFQSLASTELDEDAGREIRLSLSQLELQGLLESTPRHCFVWAERNQSSPSQGVLDALGSGFGGTARVVEKPTPVIPARTSQLLPADVRAERVARRQKQQVRTAVAVVLLAYLGGIGYAVWTLMEAKKEQATAEKRYEEIAPSLEGIDAHKRKWDELAPVVEVEHWPLELLLNCSKARPGQGLRWERAEVVNQLNISATGDLELPSRMIRLQGMADELDLVNNFNVNLQKSSALREYDWTMQPPNEDPKSGRWQFLYDGVFAP